MRQAASSVLSAQRYKRLRRLGRQVILTSDLPKDLVEAIANAAPLSVSWQFSGEVDVCGESSLYSLFLNLAPFTVSLIH